MISANLASCHCLQNGHWKSLAMMSQTCAAVSPRMRPRSARSLMLSRGTETAAAAAVRAADAIDVSVVALTVPLALSVRPHAATSAPATRSRRKVYDMGGYSQTAEEIDRAG